MITFTYIIIIKIIHNTNIMYGAMTLQINQRAMALTIKHYKENVYSNTYYEQFKIYVYFCICTITSMKFYFH